MLKRSQRLTQNQDFMRVRKRGRFVRTRFFNLAYLSRETNLNPRIGFVVSKRSGKATQRNQIKRKLREVVRAIYPLINQPVDLVIIGNKKLENCSFDEIKEEMIRVLKKIKLAGSPVDLPHRAIEENGGTVGKRKRS